MTFFEVDAQSLETFSNNLSHLGPIMDSLKSINGFDASGLGGPTMQNAMEGFAHTWSYGAGQLEKHVTSLVKNSGKAAENYLQTEQKVLNSERNLA